MAGIWRDVLGVERVGVNDNFFELGGDSLLVMKVVVRARRAGFDLTPKNVFEHQTVAELGAALDAATAGAEVGGAAANSGAALATGAPGGLGSAAATAAPGEPGTPPVDLSRYLEAFSRTADSSGVTDAYPLSPMQAGMLFHSLYAPDSGAYIEQVSFTLQGSLDVPAFERAWLRTVGRHEVLRASVAWEDLDEPLLVIHEEARPPFEVWDWRDISRVDQDRRLEETLERDRKQGFDLTCAPLLRFKLIRMRDDAYRFVFTHHHIILDGWCNAGIVREVLAEYERRAAPADREPGEPGGASAELEDEPEQSRPFRDYIAWLQGQDRTSAESFWRKRLQGFSAPTELAVDRGVAPRGRRAVSAEEAYAEREFVLPPGATEGLRSLARRNRVTLNTVVQASWALLLSRYSGEKDVVFGVTVAGRPPDLAGVETMVGCFINTVPFRARVDPESTLPAWLGDLQANQAELGRFEWTSLVDIQGWSDVPRGLPLFETILVFQGHAISAAGGPAGGSAGGPTGGSAGGVAGGALGGAAGGSTGGSAARSGLEVEDIRFVEQANYPLVLNVEPGRETVFRFLYDRRRFDDEAIERVWSHLRTLLEDILERPEARLGSFRLLPAAEENLVVRTWNSTEADFGARDLCLHDLVEAQVRRTPEGVAVVSREGRLTYAELDRAAGLLAERLRGYGVAADVPVGVMVDRSLGLVIGLLAVLKAGGAYVPLDTDLPAARVAQLLHDAAAPVCLVGEHDAAKVPAGVRAVIIDPATGAEFGGEPERSGEATSPAHKAAGPGARTAVRGRAAFPESLVSVFYTSGSTGQPKGVTSTHEGWVNRMLWMQRDTPLGPGDSVLQKTTLTFDDSAVEFFWPLISGATVVMLPPGEHRDPRAILAEAARNRVTALHFVPSMLTEVLAAAEPSGSPRGVGGSADVPGGTADAAGLPALRHVISSGEALRPGLVRQFREKIGCALYNQWGATEVSIDSTRHTCGPEDGLEDASVPVGRPIANNQAYVLDAELRPVPIGVAGEIYLAGIGLARGYLGDPAKTAQTFVPNPFVPGARMYRTGDRGYWRADGVLGFLGRRDEQVKIRGQRVELGEIEATLAAHPAVRECAVVARRGAGGYRLTAYYILRAAGPAPEGVAAGEAARLLRTFLLERLPDYMVPGRFVELDSFPFTPSGKLDRKLLPDPGDERPDLAEAYVAPRTPTEETIAAIWQEVLGLSQVGVDDRFFDLGGHSLDATRIMSRVNRELGLALPLKVLFETLTVARLAERADEAASEAAATSLRTAPIPRLPAQADYELSHAQERFWFQYQFDPSNALGFVFTPEIEGPLDEKAFLKAFRDIALRHGVIRTVFTETPSGPRQIVRGDLGLECGFRDLSRLEPKAQRDELAGLVAQEARTPFDLERASSFRVTLCRLDPLRHVLLVAVHAIAFDGWSTEVLMRDLTILYRAYRAGLHAPDLPPALQYVDFAAWHNDRLRRGELEDQKRYWLGQLATAGPPPELPPDFPSPPEDPPPMRPRITPIGAGLSGGLRRLAGSSEATLYMVLLAGLKIWLFLATGETDITVCSPLSGRNHPDLEGVLGLLVNPVALRTDLSGNPTVAEVIGRVRQSALGAHANQDYPFDLVIQDLRRQRGAERPLYTMVFVVQNATDHFLDLDGVTFKGYSVYHEFSEAYALADEIGDDPTVRIDLHVEVFETGNELSLLTRYDSRRYRAETVDRFLEQYRLVLERMMADPSARLSQLQAKLSAAFSSAGPGGLDDLFGEGETAGE